VGIRLGNGWLFHSSLRVFNGQQPVGRFLDDPIGGEGGSYTRSREVEVGRLALIL